MVAATRRTSILDLLADRASISSGEVADLLGVTRQTAHRHLAGLVRTGDLARTGQGRAMCFLQKYRCRRLLGGLTSWWPPKPHSAMSATPCESGYLTVKSCTLLLGPSTIGSFSSKVRNNGPKRWVRFVLCGRRQTASTRHPLRRSSLTGWRSGRSSAGWSRTPLSAPVSTICFGSGNSLPSLIHTPSRRSMPI